VQQRQTRSSLPLSLQHNQVTLPLVSSEMTVSTALSTMRSRACAGLVILDGSDYWLIEAASVVIAISDRHEATTIGELARRRVLFAPMPDFREANVDIKLELRDWLDHFDVKYAAVATDFSTGYESVAILTYEERLRMELGASPHDCYCSVDKRPVARGRTGGNCGIPEHGRSVRCV
jgi:hypothetical protein